MVSIFVVGVLQGVGSIVVPPIRSTISKAVALEDQGDLVVGYLSILTQAMNIYGYLLYTVLLIVYYILVMY